MFTDEDLDSNIVIRYNADKEINANLKFSDDMRKKNTKSGEIGLSYPGRRLRATTEVVKISDKQYNISSDLIWGKGGKAKIETTYRQPSSLSHQLTSAIHIARKDQIVLSGLINRDPRDMKISSSVTLGKDKYEAALANKKAYKSYETHADLLYPGRHLIADAAVNWRDRYNGNVDVKWDADKDDSKRFTADAALNVNGIKNIRGSVNAEFHGRKIAANLRHQSSDKHVSHLDINYAPDKKIELDTTFSDARGWSSRKLGGSLRLTSPYRFARFIEVNAEHSIDSLQFETVADVAWSRTDKIEGTLTIKRPISLRKLETSLSVTTPFRSYRKILAEVNHRADGELATSVKAEAGRQKVDISLTASNRGSDYRREASGQLIIKSSIQDFENVVVSASHSDDGRKFDSSLTADIGRHGRYSVDFDMTHDGYSYHLSNQGKLTIATPIRHFDKVIVFWNHRCRENSIRSTLSCSWDNKKLALKIDGNHQHNYQQRLISGTLNIESPLPSLRELVLTLNHDHKEGELQSSATLVRNSYKRTEYAVSYTIDGDYNIESTAMFRCPGIDAVSAKLATKLTESPRTAELEVEWSPSDKVSVSGELTKHEWRYIDGTVRVSSPFRGFERIVANARHRKDDGVWVSTAALEYAPRREISVESKLSTESRKLAEVIVTAPFYQFQRLKLSAEHTGDISRAINSKAIFELQPQLGVLEAIVNFQNGREKSGNVRVNTPFRSVRYSEARFTYQPGKAHAEVEYLPSQVVNIDAEYRLDDTRDLSTELTITTPISSFDYIKTSFLHRGSRRRGRSVVSVEYPRRSVFSATANYQNDDKFEASLDLQAPRYDDVRLSVQHSGTARDFNSHAEVTYEKYKKIEGNVIFSIKRGVKGPVVALETVAKSPYSEDFELKLNHEGNIVNFKSNLVGYYGRPNRLTYNLGFSSSRNSLHADTDFDLQSEYSGPHSGSAAFNIRGEMRNFKLDFNENYQGRAVNTVLSVNVLNGIDSSFSLNTPYEAVRNIDASLKHNGDLRRSKSNAKLLFNREEYEADITFGSSADHVDCKVNIKTPIYGYRDLTSSLRFDGQLQRLRTSLSVEIGDGKEIQAAGNLDVLSRNKKLDLTVHTPFTDYETISVAGNFSGEPVRFELNTHVQYATRSRISVSGKFDVESRRKVLEATILTPFNGYERLSVSSNVDGDLTRFSSNANIDYSRDGKIEASVRSDLEGNVKDISANIKTPFRNFRETSVSGRIEGDLREFTSSASLQYLDGQRISFSSTVDLKGNPKSITADLRTPYRNFEEVSLVGNFNGYSKRFKADSQVSLGRSRINVVSDIDLEGSKKKISGTVRTPFQGYEQLSIEGNYDGGSSRHKAEVSVEYAPNKKVEVEAGLNLQHQRKSARASIKTPFRGFQRISANANFNGDLEKFESDAEVEYARGKKIEISSKLDIARSPKSVSLSLKTPFERFESQSLTASVSGEIRQCDVEASVTYGDRKTIALRGAVNLKAGPISVNGRVTTPYPGYETQSFAVNFDGEPLDFQTSATIDSSQLRKPILARASVAYRSPTNMDAVLTFTSAIRHAESLKLVVKNKDEQKYTTHLEAMWAPRRTIEIDGAFERTERWKGTNVVGEVSISTPFERLRKAGVRFEDNSLRKRRSAEVNIDYENRKIVSVKGSRVVNGEVSVDVDISSPRPMKLRASGQVKPAAADGSLFADWDSRDPRSNIKISGDYSDGSDAYSSKREARLNFIHPEHTASVSAKLEKSPYQFLSSGEVIFNNKKVSLESEFNDRSQGYTKMYQGTIKLTTPYRSLHLEGSHSDDVHKISDEIVASWDADRDVSKKVILSSALQGTIGNARTEFKLGVPSVGKVGYIFIVVVLMN